MEVKIVENKFAVEAPQEKVWNILPFAIFNGVEGMEKINVVSERFFHAEMPVKMAFVKINTHLSGEIVDVRELEALTVALGAKVLGGIIKVNQKIAFVLTSKGDNQTEVKCEIVANGNGPIFRWILVRQAQATSRVTIASIEKVIKRMA